MTQLDEILAQHDTGDCPTSREWRRAMVLELRRHLLVRSGVVFRRRARRRP